MKKRIFELITIVLLSACVQIVAAYLTRVETYKKGYNDGMRATTTYIVNYLQDRSDARAVESFPDHSEIPATNPRN